MKVLFIADIHGKYENLNVINKFDFDMLVVLGDIFSYYNEENNQKIITFLKKYPSVIWIKGNCDYDDYYQKYNIPVINDYINLNINNLNIYCSHGNKYNYRYASIFENDGIIVYGHEHVPYIKEAYNNIYICIGSISVPRGGSTSSFGYLEDNHFILYSIDLKIIDSITF